MQLQANKKLVQRTNVQEIRQIVTLRDLSNIAATAYTEYSRNDLTTLLAFYKTNLVSDIY